MTIDPSHFFHSATFSCNTHMNQYFSYNKDLINYNFAFASVHVCSAGCRKISSLRICSCPSWYGFSTWATPATACVKSSIRVNDMVIRVKEKGREGERKNTGSVCVKKDKRDEFPRTEHFLFVLWVPRCCTGLCHPIKRWGWLLVEYSLPCSDNWKRVPFAVRPCKARIDQSYRKKAH